MVVDLTQDMLRKAEQDLRERMDALFTTVVKTYDHEPGRMRIKKMKGGRIKLTLTATLIPKETTSAHLEEGPKWGDTTR